mmetsp:Transcript_93259/g.263298  ORF Transcript_93259/g.263298 Transcript_93259/m.263298 type:complete len:211 (+) Transcript_93259:1711-2343(+)
MSRRQRSRGTSRSQSRSRSGQRRPTRGRGASAAPRALPLSAGRTSWNVPAAPSAPSLSARTTSWNAPAAPWAPSVSAGRTSWTAPVAAIRGRRHCRSAQPHRRPRRLRTILLHLAAEEPLRSRSRVAIQCCSRRRRSAWLHQLRRPRPHIVPPRNERAQEAKEAPALRPLAPRPRPTCWGPRSLPWWRDQQRLRQRRPASRTVGCRPRRH